MSSTQEYKEARVQYWEEMLGFEYNTNSTKFRSFTACKALCDHVDAMKASAAYYNTDYQISHSKALQTLTDKFFDDWASELWPNHSKCPRWLHDNGVDRLRVPRDSSNLREHLWRFVETKCMSHFKHNPQQRGTLSLEPGSTPLAEQDQHASLWANTKRPPRPARGSKRRSNGCPPGYSYVDEYDDDDDDEEIVVCKQERSSETMETIRAKLARLGSAYHLRTPDARLRPALDVDELLGPGDRPRKRPAPDRRNLTSCGQGHDELAGVIELTNVTTRDDLFAMIQQDLQDELGVGDRFDVVRFQRTDGEAFPRPNARSVPIKRFGQQDMWKAMVKTMLEHNIGDLEGFVIVKRGVDTK